MRYLFGAEGSPTAGDGFGVLSNTTPVVFRPVKYEPPSSSLETDQSQPPETRQSPIPISPKAGSPLPKEPRSPVPVVPAEQRSTSGHTETVPELPASSSRSNRTSRKSFLGYDVLLATPMPDISSLPPVELPLSPIRTQCSSPSTPKPGVAESIVWEDYDIPDELGIVKEQIPREVRNVVLESLNEKKAMRVSRLHQEAINTQAEMEKSASDEGIDEQDIHDSSTNTSTHTSSSDYRRSQSTKSMSSFTTAGSENEDGLLHPPSLKIPYSQPTSPMPATLSPQMAQVEFSLKQSKARTTRSRKLFKLLPTSRKSQGRPNTPEGPQQTPSAMDSECTGCFDDIPAGFAVTGLSCSHKYCSLCFTQLILTASHSESTFPPKCCLHEISTTIIRSHLYPEDVAVYDQKALEYAIPIADRYYCPSPPCARWIDTRLVKRINGGIACPHCRQNICSVCRGPSHPSNEDCPQDYGLSSAMEQAEQAGWQRCFQCRTLVERNQGCRHITCRCGGEFCYTCGKRWRTCACTDADQARLDHERAVRALRREADARREEAEIAAAIAAVEWAEQRLEEERAAAERRAAEEAAELVRREEERVVLIERHFESLRQVLESVKEAQRTAIQARHQASQEIVDQMEQNRTSVVATQEREIRDEEDFLRIEGKRMMEILQRKHAQAMIETIARHRSHQDALRGLDLSDHVSRNPYQVARQSDALKNVMLEALLPTQELERVELKDQQARETKKWVARTEKAVREHDTETRCVQIRKDEKDKVRRMMEEASKREFADWKWFDFLFEDRVRMLAEDGIRFARSGADPPPPCRAPPPPPPTPAVTAAAAAYQPQILSSRWSMETDETQEARESAELGVDTTAELNTMTGEGDSDTYVRLRTWSGTPHFGLGMQMDGGLGVAVGG